MKTVNYGDPLNNKMSIRFTDKQWNFILRACNEAHVSPSDYVRLSIDFAIMLEAQSKQKGKVVSDDDFKTDSNNHI